MWPPNSNFKRRDSCWCTPTEQTFSLHMRCVRCSRPLAGGSRPPAPAPESPAVHAARCWWRWSWSTEPCCPESRSAQSASARNAAEDRSRLERGRLERLRRRKWATAAAISRSQPNCRYTRSTFQVTHGNSIASPEIHQHQQTLGVHKSQPIITASLEHRATGDSDHRTISTSNSSAQCL